MLLSTLDGRYTFMIQRLAWNWATRSSRSAGCMHVPQAALNNMIGNPPYWRTTFNFDTDSQCRWPMAALDSFLAHLDLVPSSMTVPSGRVGTAPQTVTQRHRQEIARLRSSNKAQPSSNERVVQQFVRHHAR